MKPKILFIGSIGTVAETSELQRQAYNQALKNNGVNWDWSQETYKKLLKSNGGIDRLETLSEATNQNLSDETIKNIHNQKTELAGKQIIEEEIRPREGLVDIIKSAKENHCKVAWVTTTGTENTSAILKASSEELTEEDFDYIFHREDAERGKPHADIYHIALEHFNADVSECIAIEDSKNSMLSAKSAGIFTIVTPGAYHDDENLELADIKAKSLSEISWDDITSKFQSRRSESLIS